MNEIWDYVYYKVDELTWEVHNGLGNMDEIHESCDEIREALGEALEESGVPVKYTERIFRDMLGDYAELAMSAAESAELHHADVAFG